MFCRQQAAQLRGVKGEIEAVDARLAFVGSGAPHFAREFRDTQVPDCDVYSDPSGASYRVIGARSGVLSTLDPAVIAAGFRTLRRGFRQAKTQGNALLNGGVVVMVPGNRVAWSYISKRAGDHPPTRRVLEAVGSATAG